MFQDSLGTVQNAVHKWGPAFIGLGKKLQMLEMTQASCNPMDWNVAHITICLVKNLHILGGDKNGSQSHLPRMELAKTLESGQTFSIPSIKKLIFMGLSAVIYCALDLSGLFV